MQGKDTKLEFMNYLGCRKCVNKGEEVSQFEKKLVCNHFLGVTVPLP
jgi:hypothetical protein